MKNVIPDHWQLWILVSIAFLVMSAIVRTITLNIGWSDFNANVAFIVCFGFCVVLYGTFQQLFQHIFTAKINALIKKKSYSELNTKTEEQNLQIAEADKDIDKGERIVIDYATTREKKKLKNELLAMEIESRVIMYIGDILSPHLSVSQIKLIIDKATEFFHLTRVPDFQTNEAIELPDSLTTTDMMHFGWNIAKPFKKPNLHTAYFLKQVFAHTFRNTEVYTIEKKLRLSPHAGNIKIDANVAQYGETLNNESSKLQQPKKSSDKSELSAREIAIADMELEEIPDIFNMEDVIMDSDY